MMADLVTLALKRAYYPALDRAKATPFAARFAEACANEKRSPEALLAISRGHLRDMLCRAENTVPYYRRTFAAKGVRAADVRDERDLASFPILDKGEVFEHKRELQCTAYRGKLVTGTTSGSTGIAMTFHYDPGHHAWVDAVQWRGRAWWGLERGDPCIVLWSRPVAGASARWRIVLKHRLRNAVQFDTFQEMDARMVDEILAAFERSRPRFVYGYGSSLGQLGHAMRERGLTVSAAARPAMIEYTADHMYATEREVLAAQVGAPVLSAYGSSECGGVAQQCREGRLHIAIDHTIAEFVRDDGTIADPDEVAHIVLTQLHNRAMPLVRFRVGDLGSYSLAPCPCGSPLPVMNLAVAKIVDLIDTSFKKNVSAHVLDYINLHLMKVGIRGVRQFFVEQRGRDDFRLDLVKDAVFEEAAPATFVAKMREYLGDGITVDVRYVDAIPLQSTGKRRYFARALALDERSKGD